MLPTLFVSLILTAGTVEDPRGFQFDIPPGFEPFPNFKPTATKLYAYGKNLGTPDAVTFTIDALEGPVTAGQPSKSCGLLMKSIDRTVGVETSESWNGTTLSGARLTMTHVFGEVLVLCLDVPVSPNGLSFMVSGKPANEAALRETFRAVLGSLKQSGRSGFSLQWLLLLIPVAALILWRVSASASRSSR
jgi:hypothetical protein